MITNSFTEEEILKELTADYQWVIQLARTTARKKLKKIEKSGIVNRNHLFSEPILLTPNNNRWYVQIEIRPQEYTRTMIYCCCVVESSHGNPDYYHIRGVAKGKPYFIRYSSHTIKRLKERIGEGIFQNTLSSSMCACVLRPDEVLTGVRLTDHHFLDFIEQIPDKNEIPLLIATVMGMFIAYKDDWGNLSMKTYLPYEQIQNENEKELYRFALTGHVWKNSWMFSDVDKTSTRKEATERRRRYEDVHGEVFCREISYTNEYKEKYGRELEGLVFPV